MKTYRSITTAVASIVIAACVPHRALGVGNTCARFESQYNSSVRNVDRWAGEVQRRTEESYRLEARIQARVADLVNQYNLAVANAQYLEAVSNEQTARCSINLFFGGGNWSCYASAARAADSRRRSAQNRIAITQARFNNYVATIDGQRQRQAQRVIDAQNAQNAAVQLANSSAAVVQSCLNLYPSH